MIRTVVSSVSDAVKKTPNNQLSDGLKKPQQFPLKVLR